MMSKTGSYTVGLAGHSVVLNSYGSAADTMLKFLCCDLLVDSATIPGAAYDLMSRGSEPFWSLWFGDDNVYAGTSSYDIAYTVINEVIRQCIYFNKNGCAIHAAAIESGGGGVLLPGVSGCGKSTFTSWLVTNGANYLTDELVMLAEPDFRISSFTRPISIKNGSIPVIATFLNVKQDEIVSGRNGIMLPHRLLNQNSLAMTPPLSLVLFPQYQAGAEPQISKISPAAGCLKLMECFVNARNVSGHGITYIADLARRIPIYQLVYGSFEGLQGVLNHTFPDTFMKMKKRSCL